MDVSLLVEQICTKRKELESTLCAFALTDTLLFWPEDNSFKESDKTTLVSSLLSANTLLKTSYEATNGLAVKRVNEAQAGKLQAYLQCVADDKFAVLYLAATEVRSVLLAVLFAEGKLNAEEVFRQAFFEELNQQEKWGKDEETRRRHAEILEKLKTLEAFRDERSLS